MSARKIGLSLLLPPCLLFVGVSLSAPETSGQSPATVNADIEHLVKVITDARWRVPTSKAVLERSLADSFIDTGETGFTFTKTEFIERVSGERSDKFLAETLLSETVEDVQSQIHGDMAVARYRLETHWLLNKEPVPKQFRCTDVFLRTDNTWQVVSHTETVIPGEPIPVEVDPQIYNDYVGQYRLTSAIVFTVRREAGKLLWGKFELIPESQSTFQFKLPQGSKSENALYRVNFVRDTRGKVTLVRIREFPGVEYSAYRVE